MGDARVPGVTVGLWVPGKGSYVRAFGVADKSSGAPMSTGLNMRVGSVTKTFTVTALLTLVDQGKVGLDDPIGKYVKGFPTGTGSPCASWRGCAAGSSTTPWIRTSSRR